MRKLKVALLLLFAALLSLALFACSSDDEGDNGDGDDVNTGNRIDQMSIRGTIGLTDADDSNALSSALSGLNVFVRYEGGRNSVAYDISKCTLEGTSAIKWGEVGTYYVTLKTENEYIGSAADAEVQVDIAHHFVKSTNADFARECDVCHATEAVEEIEAHLHYYSFHSSVQDDFVLDGKNVGKNLHKMGTTVAQAKSENQPTEIKSVSAGKLVKGTSITLTGTAKTAWAKAEGGPGEDKGYYFPVLGFADVNNEPKLGGTAIFVRNEGWVLWNGVGTPRMLAALTGGSNTESYNYGSHTNATGNKPDNYGSRRPSSVDAWTMWYTYSEGTPSSSKEYTERQNIELTWNYRDDGILELIYKNLDDNYSLICRTKVPDTEYYDALIHGDYVDMTFSKVTRVDKLTLSAIQYVGMKESAKKNYLENEMLNLSDLTVQAQYAQTGDQWNTVTTFDVEGKVGSNWISLSTNPLSKGMEEFRVTLTVGNTTKEVPIPSDKFINVGYNPYNEGFGTDVQKSTTNFANNGGVGNIGYAYSDAGEVKLTVSGLAQTLTSAQKSALGISGDAYTRYIAVKFFAREKDGHSKFSTTGGYAVTYTGESADVPINEAYVNVTDGGLTAELIIPLTEEIAKKGVTISGLHEHADYVLDLKGLGGFNVDSIVSTTKYALNKGGEYTITYTFGADFLKGIADRIENSVIYVNGTDRQLQEFTGYSSNTATVCTATVNGVEVSFQKSDITTLQTNRTLTVTYKLPAITNLWGNINNYTIQFRTSPNVGVEETQASNILAYDYTFAAADLEKENAVLDNGVYTKVDGSYIYLAYAANNVTNVTTSKILELNSQNLQFNVNGTPYTLTLNSDLTGNTKGLPKDAFDVKISVIGTLDDPRDTDYGFVIVIKVDTTKLTKMSDGDGGYYFDLPQTYDNDATHTYYHVDKDGKLETKSLAINSSSELIMIHEGDCRHESIVAYVVKDTNGDEVFYANPYAVGGEDHVDDGKGYCKYCGAKIESKGNITTADQGSADKASLKADLSEGQYVRVRATYGGETKDAYPQDWNGIETSIYSVDGLSWVRVRNDGPAAQEEGELLKPVYNSNQNDVESVNGSYNLYDGEEITVGEGSTWRTAKKAGSVFDITVSMMGGYIVVTQQLWINGGNDLWNEQVAIIKTNETKVRLGWRMDTYSETNAPKIVGENVKVWTGEVARNANISIGSGQYQSKLNLNAAEVMPNYYTDVTDAEEILNESFAAYNRIRVLGNALELEDAAMKTKLNIQSNDTTYRYVALAINLDAGTLSHYDKFEITTIGGDKVQTAFAEKSGDTLYAVIAVKAGAAKQYLLDLISYEGYTLQSDIVIDISGVAFSNITSSVTSNTLQVTGGSVEITYEGGNLPTGATASIDGGKTKKAITATTQLNDFVKLTHDSTNKKLTLDIEPDYDNPFGEYQFTVYDGNEIALNVYFLPSGMKDTNVGLTNSKGYVVAREDILTIVYPVDSGSNVKELYLNVNGGEATIDGNEEYLAVYNLSFEVNKTTFTSYSFDGTNLLQSGAKVILSEVDGDHYATLNIDLKKVGIYETTPYGFEIAESSDKIGYHEDTTEYNFYLVDADRTEELEFQTATSSTTNDLAKLSEGGCSVYGDEDLGRSAYKYTVKDTVVFYYGIQISIHKWTEDETTGMLVCEVCGAIRDNSNGTNGVKGHYVAPALLKDVSKNGVTVSFYMTTALGDDWLSVLRVGGAGGGGFNIGSPTIDPWNMETNITNQGMGATPRERELVPDVKGTNAWPGSAGATTPGGISPYNSTASYVTVVLDPGEEASNGIRFYRNGALAVDYGANLLMNNNQPIAKYVELLLLGMERVGFYVAPQSAYPKVTNLTVQPLALTEEQVANRFTVYNTEKLAPEENTYKYNHTTHVYPEDGLTEICTICGSVKNPHVHYYTETEHACYYCGEIAPATDPMHTFENYRCTVCNILDPTHSVHEYSATTHKCPCGEYDPDVTHHEVEDGFCTVCGVYVFETETHGGICVEKKTVENGDTTEGFWNGDGGTWALPNGDFGLRLVFSQTAAYSDDTQRSALRFATGSTEYINIRFFTLNAGNWDCWGDNSSDAMTVTLSKTDDEGTTNWTTDADVKAHLPAGKGMFKGEYEILAYRIGNSLKVICNYTEEEGTLWTITYSWATFAAGIKPGSAVITGDAYNLSETLDGYVASLTAKS